jgi:hypothetical protein
VPGKSTLAVNQMIASMKGYNPWKDEYTKTPSKGIVLVDNPIKIRSVFLNEMAKWTDMDEFELLKQGKPYVSQIIYKPTGSTVEFMTHDMDPLIFESIEADFFIADEPFERHIFIAISRGLRSKHSKPYSLLIGTPISQNWVRSDLYEPWEKNERDDIDCFRFSTYDNKKNLVEGYIEQFSRLLTEQEKKVRLEGDWFDSSGLALAHLFKDSVHQIEDFEIPRDWPCVVSIDCHPSKAHVALMLAIDPRTGRKYAIKELTAKATAAQFAERLIEWSRGYRVIDFVCDSLGSADTTGGDGFKSFIEVLNNYGVRTRPTSYQDKSDEDWIDRIRSALDIPIEMDNFGQQVPNLRVFKTCTQLIKEIKNVAWLKYKHKEENKPKLDISQKDVLACLKYALASSASIRPAGQEARPIRLGGQNSAKSVSIRSRYMSSKR